MRCFLLFLWGACAFASTLTTVICDGLTTTNPLSSDCFGVGAHVTATVTGTSVQAFAIANGFQPVAQQDTASATFSQTYSLLVTGGPAGLLFRPCISIFSPMSGLGNNDEGAAFSGSGGVQFNAFFGSPRNRDTCLAPPDPGALPASVSISQGVSKTFRLDLFAMASVYPGQSGFFSEGDAKFSGFEFYDSQLNRVSNVSFTFTPVPEPSLRWVGPLLGLALFSVRKRPAQLL